MSATVEMAGPRSHMAHPFLSDRGKLLHLPGLPPKPSILLPRLTLILSELIHVLERQPCVSKPIPLLDDLSVEESTVFQEDISQGPSISVLGSYVGVGLVKLQSHPFALDHLLSENGCLDTAAKSDLKNAITAIENHYLDNNIFPANSSDLLANGFNFSKNVCFTMSLSQLR